MDVGRDPQRDADILALDGVDDVGEVRRVPGLARDEGDVLGDDDLRLLVVLREQVGRRKDVQIVVSLVSARRTAATAGIFVPSGRVTFPPIPPAISPEPAKVRGFPVASPASRGR